MMIAVINASSALMTTARRSVQDRVKLKPRLYQELVRSTTQRRQYGSRCPRHISLTPLPAKSLTN